jgi:hypothetical protein
MFGALTCSLQRAKNGTLSLFPDSRSVALKPACTHQANFAFGFGGSDNSRRQHRANGFAFVPYLPPTR